MPEEIYIPIWTITQEPPTDEDLEYDRKQRDSVLNAACRSQWELTALQSRMEIAAKYGPGLHRNRVPLPVD